MVFTRRNLRQLGITPQQNNADLVRALARVVHRRTPPPSPATSVQSRRSTGSNSIINDALYGSDTSSQLSANSVQDWFETLPEPTQERVRRWIKRYRHRDIYHRHRLDDDQPKTERVTSYVRRRA